MDETRFDILARTLASAVTRRRTLAGLVVGAIPAAVIIEDEADAARRKRRRGHKTTPRHDGHGRHHHAAVASEKKRKKKKKKSQPTTPPPTTAAPTTLPPLTCSGGTTKCSGSCVDTTTNAQHCGGCGQPCAPGEACAGGVCGLTCGVADFCSTSGSTPDCCAGACIDTRSDVQHCGGCDDACSTQSSNQCVNSACQCGALTPCGASETCCSGSGVGAGACLNLNTDINNCGACGNVCPGYGQPGDTVTCTGGQCTFACSGAYYDINGNMADGCEQLDTQTNRTRGTSLFLASTTCDDTESHGTFTGKIYTDGRARTSPPAGYDLVTMAAPLWYRVYGKGGFFCLNDPALTVTMTGGTDNCYQVTVVANNVQTSKMILNNTATISLNSGSYNDETNVYFSIAKTCVPATPLRETPSFSASYHM